MTNAASVVQTELFSDRDQEAMIAKFVKEVFKEGVGKNIPSARKTTMEQYLKNSLRVFSKAFNKDNVQDGFRAVSLCCALLHMLASFVVLQCGWYYPHDPRKIMAKWPGWIKLEPSQGADTLEAVIELAHNIPIHGRINDPVVSERLPFQPTPSTANVAELGRHRDRTVVLNAPGYNDARDAAAPNRAAKRKKEAEAKAQEEPAIFIEYKDRGHGHFNAKQICAQLTIRGIKFRSTEKVGTLMVMWQDHDAIAANIEKLRAAQSKRSAAPLASTSTPPASPSSREYQETEAAFAEARYQMQDMEIEWQEQVRQEQLRQERMQQTSPSTRSSSRLPSPSAKRSCLSPSQRQ